METARARSLDLAALLRREQSALAEFLVALAAFDRERRWAELGYASLFAYLHRELRLSKAAAHYRKVAAELIQQVPAVVGPLRSGALCLTSIVEVARVVTPENCETLLPRFFGLSRREATGVVAELQPDPEPPIRTVVTRVATAARSVEAAVRLEPARADAPVTAPPPPWAAAPPLPLVASADQTTLAVHASSPGELPACRPAAVPARPEIVPLTADQRRLHVTVSAAFVAKLEQARASRPDLSEEEILEAGLDLLLRASERRKGLVDRPRAAVRPSNPEHVPARVKREVWTRDGGKCGFTLASGERCGSTHDLQFDHRVPLALGGESTAGNVRLRCGSHNREEARRIFGDAVMDRYCGKGKGLRQGASARAARPTPGVERDRVARGQPDEASTPDPR